MNVAANLVKVAKTQNILKLLTYLQLTAYLWPPDAAIKDGACADFVIIGGGTAGCIIASNLTKHKNVSVLVIEAGGTGEFETQEPGLFPYTKNTDYDWKFKTVDNRNIQQGKVCDRIYKSVSDRQIYIVTHGLLYPDSRGEILLNSTDPEENPIIKPRYYSNHRDIERHAEYLEHYNRVVNTTYFKSIGAKFIDPGLEMCKGLKYGSHGYWKCYVRGMASTLHNYVGTCAMGSVVDSQLRVIGVKGVRVADASVMPEIVGANVEASVNIISQKLVDILTKEYKLSTC